MEAGHAARMRGALSERDAANCREEGSESCANQALIRRLIRTPRSSYRNPGRKGPPPAPDALHTSSPRSPHHNQRSRTLSAQLRSVNTIDTRHRCADHKRLAGASWRVQQDIIVGRTAPLQLRGSKHGTSWPTFLHIFGEVADRPVAHLEAPESCLDRGRCTSLKDVRPDLLGQCRQLVIDSILRKRKRRTLSKTYKCNHDKRDLHERDPDERGQHERGQHERGEREQQEQREDESLQHSRTKSEPQRGEDEAEDENDDADDAGRDHGDEDDQQPHVRAREKEYTAHE